MLATLISKACCPKEVEVTPINESKQENDKKISVTIHTNSKLID